jgi:dTMP kinase
MFITFEGLDFSGKSTQISLLADRLSREGFQVKVVRDPGGTDIGEKVRSILLDKESLRMADLTELFLFSASRSQLVQELILPALERGTIVVCDRFYDSTTAYQGWGRGLPLDVIRTVNHIAASWLVPDITFFMDIPVHEVEGRMHKEKSRVDRMESSGKGFYEVVRKGYLQLAAEEKRFEVVDGLLPVEAVHAIVWRRFQKQIVHEREIQR